MVELDKLQPQLLRFGECLQCPYLQSGWSSLCYSCAAREVDGVASSRCLVCDQPLQLGQKCRNFWCSSDDRYFEQIFAIAMYTNPLQRVLKAYKYGNVRDWGAILGRVLAGYLLDNADTYFSRFDLIVSSPTYQGVGARHQWDHVAHILASAYEEAGTIWPFEYPQEPVIVKLNETTKPT